MSRRVPVPVEVNADNVRYLTTKQQRMGHDLPWLSDYIGGEGDQEEKK